MSLKIVAWRHTWPTWQQFDTEPVEQWDDEPPEEIAALVLKIEADIAIDAAQALIAELEAERDAYTARYRWLADKVMACDYADNEFGIVGWIIRHCKGPTWIPGASIDAAIDAARSTQP